MTIPQNVRRFAYRALFALTAAAGTFGCLGRIGDTPNEHAPGSPTGGSNTSTGATGAGDPGTTGSSSSGTPGTTGTGGPDPACSAGQATAATLTPRIRRLTKLEIRNTIADLSTDAIAARTNEIEADPRPQGFSTGDERSVDPAYMDTLQRVTQLVAADYRKSIDKTKLAPTCFTSDAAARGCATDLVRDFVSRAYRRAVVDTEIAALLAVYDAGRGTGIDDDFADRLAAGVEYVVRAALMSPDFIFRTELGPEGAGASPLRLVPMELASAISYAVVASPPDATLIDAAKADALATPAQVEAQVHRLIEARPQRFQAEVQRFLLDWLGIDFDKPEWSNKDKTLYPTFTTATRDALRQEMSMYLDDWTSTGPFLPALLTSPSTFVNQANARVYGTTSTSATFQKLALDPKQRAGILTSPGFLGTYAHTDASSPVFRGMAVMRHLLCQEPPPVPAMVPPLPPIDKTDVKTTRQRYDKHASLAFCSACHSAIDPLGDVFESYDAVGAYRTEENGVPIDSSGAIVGTVSSNARFDNAVDMVKAMAKSPEVHECFARQVYRFTAGRAETEADQCAIRGYASAFTAKGFDLRELMVAVVSSPAFALRTPPANP